MCCKFDWVEGYCLCGVVAWPWVKNNNKCPYLLVWWCCSTDKIQAKKPIHTHTHTHVCTQYSDLLFLKCEYSKQMMMDSEPHLKHHQENMALWSPVTMTGSVQTHPACISKVIWLSREVKMIKHLDGTQLWHNLWAMYKQPLGYRCWGVITCRGNRETQNTAFQVNAIRPYHM